MCSMVMVSVVGMVAYLGKVEVDMELAVDLPTWTPTASSPWHALTLVSFLLAKFWATPRLQVSLRVNC